MKRLILKWLAKRRARRIAELEASLGAYQEIGSGPFGSTNWHALREQFELEKLRAHGAA
jgi:hypothetical protein